MSNLDISFLLPPLFYLHYLILPLPSFSTTATSFPSFEAQFLATPNILVNGYLTFLCTPKQSLSSPNPVLFNSLSISIMSYEIQEVISHFSHFLALACRYKTTVILITEHSKYTGMPKKKKLAWIFQMFAICSSLKYIFLNKKSVMKYKQLLDNRSPLCT